MQSGEKHDERRRERDRRALDADFTVMEQHGAKRVRVVRERIEREPRAHAIGHLRAVVEDRRCEHEQHHDLAERLDQIAHEDLHGGAHERNAKRKREQGYVQQQCGRQTRDHDAVAGDREHDQDGDKPAKMHCEARRRDCDDQHFPRQRDLSYQCGVVLHGRCRTHDGFGERRPRPQCGDEERNVTGCVDARHARLEHLHENERVNGELDQRLQAAPRGRP